MGQNQSYLKTLHQLELSLNDKELRDRAYCRDQYLLADEADQYYVQTERSFKRDENIQQKQQYLDQYYIAEKLSDACEMLMRSAILKVQYDVGLLSLALREVEEI